MNIECTEDFNRTKAEESALLLGCKDSAAFQAADYFHDAYILSLGVVYNDDKSINVSMVCDCVSAEVFEITFVNVKIIHMTQTSSPFRQSIYSIYFKKIDGLLEAKCNTFDTMVLDLRCAGILVFKR